MIYFRYIKMTIKGQMQYPASFVMMSLGQSLVTAFLFLGIQVMFDRFGSLKGWSFEEVALCYGATGCSFALAECVARGFDLFSRMIVKGDFDRVLLRPRPTVLQVLGGSFEMTKIGRFALSLVILLIAVHRMQLSAANSLLVAVMVLSGTVIFAGVFILGATVCFFTTEGLEVVNVFTDGGRELASYPLSIYAKGVAQFFTFIIPYGCFNYLPLLYIVGRVDTGAIWYVISPVLGMLFIIPCIFVWNWGAKHYLSTGS